MDTPPSSESREDLFPPADPFNTERAEQNLWQVLGVLVRWRRFIIGLTLLVAVLSVGISLLLPNWYAASTRLLTPASGSNNPLASQLLRNLPSAATALLGGTGGDFARYLTILSSRRVYESVVDSFDLVTVYNTGESATPRENAIAMLATNIDFPVDEEYEFLSVVVLDTDPQRAADMSNFFVERLNEINADLATQSARSYRQYIQLRYGEAIAALDSVLDATQAFQRKHKIFELETQTRTFFEQLAGLRADIIQVEIQHQALQQRVGPNNAEVRALGEVIKASKQKYQEALAGQEALLPVAQGAMPDVLREYLDLRREALIQERILEVVAPLLEQARFNEEQQNEAVQIVDPAVPPVKKAKPRRSIICIVATLSAFLLALIFVLLYEWWRHYHAYFSHRLNEAVAKTPPPKKI